MTSNNPLITQPNTSVTVLNGSRINLNIAPPTEVGGGTLTIKITNLPTGGSIFLPNGQAVTVGEVLTATQLATLIYQAPASGGGALGGFGYQVTDAKGATASQTVALTLDAPPVVEANKTISVAQGTKGALAIAQPTDAAGNPMTITVTSLPWQGAVQLATGQAVTVGETLTAAQLAGLVFQAPAGSVGASGGFSYQVKDSLGASASETVSLSVTAPLVVEANKAIAVADGSRTSLNIAPPSETGNNALVATVTGVPTKGTIVLAGSTSAVTVGQTLTAYQLATLIYQAPASGSGGMGGFSYQVSDGKGGTASETVSLSVIAPPTVEANKTVTALQGAKTALSIATPTDAAGNPMTITVTSLPWQGGIQLATGQAVTVGETLTAAQLSGLVFLAPAGSVGASGGFGYQVTDGKGGIACETVSLTVTAPLVVEASKALAVADGSRTSLNIAPPSETGNNALVATVTGVPTKGSIVLAGSTSAVTVGQTLSAYQLATLIYQAPASGSGGMGGFSYQVADGLGATASETVSLSIAAPTPPPAPVAPPVVEASKALSVAEGGQAGLNIAAPTDAAGNPLTITVTSLPTKGSIVLANNQAVTLGEVLTAAQLTGLLYQAPSTASGGMGGFAYQVTDGKGNSVSETVSLSVTAPPPPPAAPPVAEANFGVTMAWGTTVALGITAPTDAAGNPLTITVTGLPQTGSLVLANGAAVTTGEVLSSAQLTGLAFQVPASGGKIGAATLFGDFTYSVSDGKGGLAQGDVTLFGNPITTGTPVNPSAAAVIDVARQSFIARPDALINLGEMFQVPTGANAPATIVVTSEDSNQYAGAETYDYGTLTAKSGVTLSGGYTLTFSLVNGQYVTTNSASFSSTNGETLSDFTFRASDQNNRVQNFSVTAFDQNGNALQTQNVAIVTSPNAVDATPGVATAAEVVQVAQSFLGQTWDSQGCWNLAQDISARAGASLSLSTENGIATGTSNGQWSVVYDAATSKANPNWMSTLQAGDVVQLDWNNANFGHIAVVSQVTNGQVYIIDNSGPAVTTPGSDPSDVQIAQTNLTAEAANINPATVEVYRLTGAAPAVADLPPTVAVGYNTNLQIGQTVAASTLFQASDPDNQAVTGYEVLDAGGGSGHFALNGVTQADGQWINVTPGSLANLTYTAGTGASTDSIEVMATDGQVWSGITSGRAVTLPTGTANANSATPTNLGTLSGNAVLTATDQLSPTDTQHFYSFTVASAAAVTVTLTDLAANCDLYIYGPAGSGFSTGSTKGGTQDQSITATLAAGTYLVRPAYQTGATQSNASDFNLAIGLGNSVVTPVPPLVPPPPQTQLLASSS